MKNLFILTLITALTLPTFAITASVTGNGQESKLCSEGPVGDRCIQSTKEASEKNATRDAEWICQANSGEADLHSATCNSSCFPNYVPPSSGPMMIRCSATCTLACEI